MAWNNNMPLAAAAAANAFNTTQLHTVPLCVCNKVKTVSFDVAHCITHPSPDQEFQCGRLKKMKEW